MVKSRGQVKSVVEWVSNYFLPENQLARKLRKIQEYAGKHRFTVTYGVLDNLAKQFEQFKQ